MLGFEVAQSTVSKYMARTSKLPSQPWKTFLRNHAEAIAAIDVCVVPTLTFDLLSVFLVVGHGRRWLLWFEVTRHPTAEWLARQINEAFPWTSLVSAIDESLLGRRGRMVVPNVGSAHCAASAWIKYSSSARRTCGEFFPPMRRITIKHAPTWY